MRRNVSQTVSVVIPVYNRAELVVRTLDSVAAQTVLPTLILVDNGSTDGSLEVVTAWAEAHRTPGFPIIVLSEPTPGACAARNRGLDGVTTPYVLFFDSDDEMRPRHIERLCDAIMSNPDVDIFGWDVEILGVDGSRRVDCFVDRDMEWRNIFNAILATQRYAVRTSLVREVGGWNVDLRGWNDYELGFRLLSRRPRAKKLHGPITVKVNCQPESITGLTFSAKAGVWEAALASCEDDLLSAGRSNLLRWVMLKRMVLAALYAREGCLDLARGQMEYVLAREKSGRRRTLYRAAYHYTRCGLRGIHYLLRPLL